MSIPTTQPIKLKQPRVLSLAYATTICERFGFYVLSYLLVLYVKEIYGLTDTSAFLLFSTFTAFAFLTPAIGGYVADNVIGIRRCIVWGLILEGIGLLILALPTTHPYVFYLGLSLIILGVGLFKTAPTDLLARAYTENDPRIDSGFTLYYMSINIGSLASSFLAGFIQSYYGWHIAFLVAGIGILLGAVFYFTHVHTADGLDTMAGEMPLAIRKILGILAGLIISALVCMFFIANAKLFNIFMAVATVAMFGYFAYEIFRSPKDEKMRIFACIYLILIGFAASIIYFQGFTSIELFIDRVIDRNMFGMHVPTVAFLSLNPIFVIILSPILATIYNRLEAQNRDLSVMTKISLGLLSFSLCFFCLVIGGTYFVDAQAHISSIWLIATYLLYTIGDILTGALGLAMVVHIAPKRMYGVMMGAWFLIGNALAAAVSGVFAGIAEVPATITDPHTILLIYNSAFTKIGIAGVAVSIIVFAINPHIRRIAKLNRV